MRCFFNFIFGLVIYIAYLYNSRFSDMGNCLKRKKKVIARPKMERDLFQR